MTQPRPEPAYSGGMTDDHRLHAIDDAAGDPAREAHTALEATMFEVKRVIVGQEAMLERLLVALLAGDDAADFEERLLETVSRLGRLGRRAIFGRRGHGQSSLVAWTPSKAALPEFSLRAPCLDSQSRTIAA